MVLFQEQAEGEVALDQARAVEEELCRARGAAVEVASLEQVAGAGALFLG